MDRRNSMLALLAGSYMVAGEPVQAAQSGLRIGLTPVILADQVAFLSRWGSYLTSTVGCPIEFVARESYQLILDMLFSEQIDAAWICGYPFVRYRSSLSLLAVPIYAGQPTYQAYLIRPRKPDALVHGWADLRGKVLAYSDPLSNSGWLVAQAEMAKAGVKVAELKRTFFAHGHRNVAEAVAAQLADAGSIDGYVWETMRQQGMKAASQTEVVWRSEHFGFPPLVSKRGNRHPYREALQQALLGMAQDPAGAELLTALNLSGFTLGGAQMFDSIRKQARSVAASGVSI
jgi:phosphonate transport system substrate-binding protein